MTKIDREQEMVEAHLHLRKEYYGKGYPGWNATVRAYDPETNQEVGYASWPNVNGPTYGGVLYGRVRAVRRLFRGAADGAVVKARVKLR